MLLELAGEGACVSCGIEVARAELMFVEQGGVCPACFLDASTPTTASPWWELVRSAALPIGLCLYALGLAYILRQEPDLGQGVLTWIVMASVGACLGAFASLQAGQQVREGLRLAEAWGPSAWLQLGVGAVLTASSLAATVGLAILTILPFL